MSSRVRTCCGAASAAAAGSSAQASAAAARRGDGWRMRDHLIAAAVPARYDRFRPPMRFPAVLALAAACAAAPASDAAEGRRIFISADMEGIAGVVTNEQLGPPGFEYGRFRE